MLTVCLCRDTDIDATNSWQVIRDLELDAVATEDDVIILRYLCSALSIRAAQLVGACTFLLFRLTNGDCLADGLIN